MAVMEDEVGLQEMAIGLFEDDDDSSDDDVLCEERQESRSEKQNQDKKTLKDRVRQQRHREMEKKHVSKRELKRLRREIDSLPQLCGSLTENDQALAARRARRQVLQDCLLHVHIDQCSVVGVIVVACSFVACT